MQTKMLKMFHHIESRVTHIVPERKCSKHISIHSIANRDASLSFMHKVAVDYRIEIGARMIVEDTPVARDHARSKVAAMLGREVFGDLRDELLDLLHWSYEEGIGQDLEDRISRLIKLTEGREVGAN